MPLAPACPSFVALQQLLSGKIALADALELESHVEICTSCQQSLQDLDVPDGLVETARAAKTRSQTTPSPDVDRLIERLRQMPPNGPESVETVAGNPSAIDTNPERPVVLAPPQSPDEIGRLGPYRILGVLGQGGMGVVFRAEDVQLRRLVALKVINPRLASTALVRERFLREARAAAAIEHDHIIPLYQVGEEGNVLFLAFPLLKGESLEDRLKREKILPLQEVLRIGRQIALGLAAAHEQGLIHRDIKPANIWLERDQGRVRVLDFGLARAIHEAQDDVPQPNQLAQLRTPSMTQTGAVFGTPSYMAPEQARGKSVDVRADLFSLGVVLYRLATSKLPWAASNLTAALQAFENHQPAAPKSLNRRLPGRLSQLIMQLLAAEPSSRPESSQAVAARLEEIASAGRKRRQTFALVGVTLGLLATAIFLAVLSLNRPGASQDKDPHEILGIHEDGLVHCVAVSHDGKTILSGGEDLLHLRERTTGRLIRSFEAQQGSIYSVAFSQDDRQALTANMEDGAHLWDVATGREVGRFNAPSSSTVAVALAGDGRHCLTGHLNGSMRLWDVSTGTELRRFNVSPVARVWCVGFSTDGRLALSSDGNDNGLRIWDVKSGKEIADLRGTHLRGVLFGAFSPDGRFAVSSCFSDKTVRVWDLESRKEIRCLEGHNGDIQQVAFSPDGRLLLSAGGNDRTARLWELESGHQLACFRHADAVRTVAFVPDGHSVVSCGYDQTIRVWEIPETARSKGDSSLSLSKKNPPRFDKDCLVEDRLLATLPKAIWRVAFSFDGSRAYASADDGTVVCCEVTTGRQLFACKHAKAVPALALSHDGRFLITGGRDQTVRCWDAITGNELRRFENDPKSDSWSLTASPTSNSILGNVMSENWLWNPGTGKRVRHWPLGGQCAFLPDGKSFLCGNHKTLCLVPLEPGGQPRELSSSLSWIRRVAVSDNGHYGATGHGNRGNSTPIPNDDYTVRIWDLNSGRLLKRFGGFKHTIWGLAFAPDNRRLFTCSLDGSIHVFDVQNLQEIWKKETLVPFNDIAVSRDGRNVITGNTNGEVRLWRVDR